MELVKRGWQLWWTWQDADGYHAKRAGVTDPEWHTFTTRHIRDRFINGTEYLGAYDPRPIRPTVIRGL